MKAKILLALAIATMFLGCSFFDDNQPILKKPKQAVKATPTKSSIKGFIKEVTYKDSKYCYEIVASDTKNNKLNKANFCANRYYHDKGDLVYATFYADKLIDMLLIKEGGSSSRSFGSSIGLSYEIDLWQKLANSKDAAMFEARASKFDLEASKLSVVNSVSDAYFQILYLNESIKTYEQILEIYNELNKIVGLKFELGKEEALSLKQINSQLLSAQNKIESAKKELISAKKTLRILLNERPEFELKFEGLTLSPVKRVGVDLDVPTSAIANRPDLRAAIFRIEEGILNYKASQKEFYPSITLGASLKSSTDKKEEAFSLKFLNGNIALNLPFLNYHKLKSNLKVSEANFELAKLNYISTLNSALNEIDAFYKSYVNDETLLKNYQEQIKNYEEISKIYELKYSYGKVELKQFLEAKRIQPSMSRIGSSPDNAMMEFFFDILKSEMFYGYDKTSKSLNQLEQAIVDYIDYYNNKRIKVKLKQKRQSQETSTKPHTIASIHRLIRTMYYLITHNKLYDYTSTQNQ